MNRTWRAAGAAVAVGAVVTSFLPATTAGRIPLGVLVVTLGAMPGVTAASTALATRGAARRPAGIAAGVLGLALGGYAMAIMRPALESLWLVRRLGGWWLAVRWVDGYLPLGILATGVAVALTGLAAPGDDGPRRHGTRLAAATSAVFTAGLLLTSVARSRGHVVAFAPGLARAVVLGAACLLLLTAGRYAAPATAPGAAPTVRPWPDRPRPAGAAPRGGIAVLALASAAVATLALVVAVGVPVWSARAHDPRVSALFPDPVLARCVADTLHVAPDDTVSGDDLASVLTLGCHGARTGGTPVRDLAGLDRLPRLVALNLADNALRDLGPLGRLPHPERVGTLTLTNNRIADLTPVAAFTRVQDLGLSRNELTDLTPLRRLTAVRYLGLAFNRISDVSALAAMPGLVRADLAENRVQDLTALQGAGELERLAAGGNRIADLAPLVRLPRLAHLDVARNQVADVAPLRAAPALEELRLGGNPLRDLSPLTGLRSLTGVDLRGSRPPAGVELLRRGGVYVGGLA